MGVKRIDACIGSADYKGERKEFHAYVGCLAIVFPVEIAFSLFFALLTPPKFM